MSERMVETKRMMRCPKCGKRAFDISELPKDPVYVCVKCPNCRNIVSVPCNEKSEIAAAT